MSIDEAGAIITKDELPKIKGDERQLGQLFQNLISNALKYNSPDRKVNVHISAKRSGKYWQFSVADNGIGIAQKYFDIIFVIFKRLHGKDSYSGTGIGLSICKKIVDNHNGKIWLESEVDRGSTFYFELPAN